jgi:hypothetical protein
MIINFDSEKQRNYWVFILGGLFVLGWIFKSIFKYYDDEISEFFIYSLIIWVTIGKYILRLCRVE